MKKVTFKPPYRVGRKSGTTVLDSNGIEVVNFRDEEKAQDYVNFLNKKEREKDFINALGESMMDEVDNVITLHKPKSGMDKDIIFTPPKMRDYRLAPNQLLPLIDEVRRWQDTKSNLPPWFVFLDHPTLVTDSVIKKHADNPLLGKDMAKLWAKVARERENDPNYESCCDKDNPCSCQTFSPSMPSPNEVRDFLDIRKVKVTEPDKITIFIMALKKTFSLYSL